MRGITYSIHPVVPDFGDPFILDGDGEITYSWVADDPINEPDYDALYEATEAAA